MRTPFLSSDSVSNTMISVYLQLGVLLILCMAIAVECTYKCIQNHRHEHTQYTPLVQSTSPLSSSESVGKIAIAQV